MLLVPGRSDAPAAAATSTPGRGWGGKASYRLAIAKAGTAGPVAVIVKAIIIGRA